MHPLYSELLNLFQPARITKDAFTALKYSTDQCKRFHSSYNQIMARTPLSSLGNFINPKLVLIVTLGDEIGRASFIILSISIFQVILCPSCHTVPKKNILSNTQAFSSGRLRDWKSSNDTLQICQQ